MELHGAMQEQVASPVLYQDQEYLVGLLRRRLVVVELLEMRFVQMGSQ